MGQHLGAGCSSLRLVMMSCLNSQKEARDRVIKKNPERKFWWGKKKGGPSPEATDLPEENQLLPSNYLQHFPLTTST